MHKEGLHLEVNKQNRRQMPKPKGRYKQCLSGNVWPQKQINNNGRQPMILHHVTVMSTTILKSPMQGNDPELLMEANAD